MKKTLWFVLLPAVSFAQVVHVKLVPDFHYEQSLYSCDHREQIMEFSFVGNFEDGKLTSGILTERENGGRVSLTPAEVAQSSVALDFGGQWWLSSLTLSPPTLSWLLGNLGGRPRCPWQPLVAFSIDSAPLSFAFTGQQPGLDRRYAPVVTFQGSRAQQGGYQSYRASLGFYEEQAY